ncbi:AtpZ/AtpI family protein [Dokdonia sp. PRO95]|uniref:AtpZ/AtpI family protein n=1 Tax=unclassified Dokdonia TaxID=2615033 RepID=UPI000554768D|nr:AtpZ/AtpI family protein [Dokdonia sp. PRO95]
MAKEKKGAQLNRWVKFSTIPFQMGATIYLGNLLGTWLDVRYETEWVETTITLIAVFLSIYIVIKGVIQLNK